ncbi:unnamed protein product, partial [Mesorhabditis spiculigera]
MQRELFRALIFQLIVPLICVFSPMGFFFLAAVTGFEDWNSDIVSVMLMFDPILEPLVLMSCLRCYRAPMLRWFHCERKQVYDTAASGRLDATADPVPYVVSRNRLLHFELWDLDGKLVYHLISGSGNSGSKQ